MHGQQNTKKCRRHQKIKNKNINLEKVHFVGLYCITKLSNNGLASHVQCLITHKMAVPTEDTLLTRHHFLRTFFLPKHPEGHKKQNEKLNLLTNTLK